RVNRRYLPEFQIPAGVRVTADLSAALAGSELLLVATTTGGLRPLLKQLVGLGQLPPIVRLCKGFEIESAQLPHQISAAELGAGIQCGALSGPSFAHEVAGGLPTALTLASADPAF